MSEEINPGAAAQLSDAEKKESDLPKLTARTDISDDFGQVLIKAGETAVIYKTTPDSYYCRLPNGSDFHLPKDGLFTIN
ncbi:MAG: hypothetical protein HN981_02175 [Candidatus Pacebacteria bacterium]|jgi:hypothetical protein|nr:hypothetical protein [Candidatus Paceibacterota bacterium]MBT6921179.1 hypothetical protein [Candidatus Paceibacterota bacterium]